MNVDDELGDHMRTPVAVCMHLSLLLLVPLCASSNSVFVV